MRNTVLLGGNGYIGREIIKYWLKKDKDMVFYVISRKGSSEIKDDRVINLKADVSDYESTVKVLPEKIDYIINLVGGPEKNEKIFNQKNRKPAEVMLRIAEEKNVRTMGFIGGKLGPKAFVEVKKELIEKLSKSRIRLEYVEPTIVYGNGRNDTLAKLIPIFKFLGLFNKNMKPVQVDDIVRELVSNLEGKWYENK